MLSSETSTEGVATVVVQTAMDRQSRTGAAAVLLP